MPKSEQQPTVVAARQQRGWRRAQGGAEGGESAVLAGAGEGSPEGAAGGMSTFAPPTSETYRESLLQEAASRSDLDVDNVLWWFKNELNARFFQQVPMHIAKTMVRSGEYRSVKKGEVIIRQGDRAQRFFVIISGKVNVHLRDEDDYGGSDTASMAGSQSRSPTAGSARPRGPSRNSALGESGAEGAAAGEGGAANSREASLSGSRAPSRQSGAASAVSRGGLRPQVGGGFGGMGGSDHPGAEGGLSPETPALSSVPEVGSRGGGAAGAGRGGDSAGLPMDLRSPGAGSRTPSAPGSPPFRREGSQSSLSEFAVLQRYGKCVSDMSVGMVFGEMSILQDTVRLASCVAGEDTEIMCIPRECYAKSIRRMKETTVLPDSVRLILLKEPFSRAMEEVELCCKVIANIHFFNKLSRQAMIGVVQNMRLRSMPDNSVLFKQGDTGQEFFVILTGSVSIHQRRVGATPVAGQNRGGGDPANQRGEGGGPPPSRGAPRRTSHRTSSSSTGGASPRCTRATGSASARSCRRRFARRAPSPRPRRSCSWCTRWASTR